jgi:hypothetical protein
MYIIKLNCAANSRLIWFDLKLRDICRPYVKERPAFTGFLMKGNNGKYCGKLYFCHQMKALVQTNP